MVAIISTLEKNNQPIPLSALETDYIYYTLLVRFLLISAYAIVTLDIVDVFF